MLFPKLCATPEMVTFDKIKQEILRLDTWCHILVRHLKPNQNISNLTDSEIIEGIIKSRFHHWRGEEEPNGIVVSESPTSKNKNLIKFYGYYDFGKITSSDYRLTTFEEFKTRLFRIIDDWNNSDRLFRENSEKLVLKMIYPDSLLYHLDLDINKNQDKVSEWHVYSVFTAFIAIDRIRNILTLIEFGQD